MVKTWYKMLSFTLLLYCQICCLAKSFTSLATDQSALVSFKAHLTTLDPYGIMRSNWTNSSHVCSWIGVTCGSRHRRVVALDVSNMSLTGTLPTQLGNLSFLIALKLKYNHFSGNMPQELSHLRRLKFLSIKVNNFTGEIPPWIGNLQELRLLSLRNNSFTGFIPNSIANLSNLEILDFSFNSLQGPIPEELGKLQSLQVLNMQYNSISGTIPSSIFNLSALKNIAFTVNELSGNLPIHMCRDLPFLEGIYLSKNQLSGQIVSNLSECSQLRSLSLAYNLFSGHIPGELGKIQHLKVLSLGGNKLIGSIPENIGNLNNLKEFTMERNQITGTIPLRIFNNSDLSVLVLAINKLTGNFPREVKNLTMLKILNLSNNNLTGVLPQGIGQLHQLEELVLGHNSFSSSIPLELFNISTLRILALTAAGVEGSISSSICNRLPALESLFLNMNNLVGTIPDSICNCSKLKLLDLTENKFSGFVPHFFGNLRLLEHLQLAANYLSIKSFPPEESFITSLTNCRFLETLTISENHFIGIIPASIGNFTNSFKVLRADNCEIQGNIPSEIGNLSSLMALFIQKNRFTGDIPHTIHRFHQLQGLYADTNNLKGSIPEGLCNLHNLVDLYLSENHLSGSIPECLGNVTNLRRLALDSNMLTSSIPSSLWHIKDLLDLDLNSNSLRGSIQPEIGNLMAAYNIDLSKNQLSGHIPTTIEKLQSLINFSLGYNRLQDSIPISIGRMINLENLDLSHNNLTGSIPISLQGLQHLITLDLSYNDLTGEIPTGGPFKNLTMESLKGNKALCGIARFHVPPCHKASEHGSRRIQLVLYALFGVIACIIVVASIFIFILRCKRRDKEASRFDDNLMRNYPERISYYQLLLATDHFDESNLLGMGSFGSIFKGTFGDGMVLAVKVFNLHSGADFRSFDVECEVLRNIRHRNLIKVFGSCSNEDFKALILEYMPNGSLEKWLYSHNYCLDISQRMNVMIDVGLALEYLHHGYATPIVHCDLKPSNVLLDGEMVALVSDFGIAKMLNDEGHVMHTNTLATLGYMAPEYGSKGLVSTKCDVYSYGIMLMEMFTRKRPSDEMFQVNLSLKSWVEGLHHDSLDQLIDANLLNPHLDFNKTMQCAASILELALKCSTENPKSRMNIKDAAVELQKIKTGYIASSMGIRKWNAVGNQRTGN